MFSQSMFHRIHLLLQESKVKVDILTVIDDEVGEWNQKDYVIY